MASVNPLSRELVFKIVYYGPGLGGKTTTLEYIHATAKPDHKGKLVSLATPVDRTLYFDFLPMRLPPIRGMHVRLQLFTVPGQVYFNATRKLVLTGADGIVFVADAQTARGDANQESLDNLRDNLADQGRNLSDVPIVFQYNKYDLDDVLPIAELDQLLNRWKAPSLPTSAKTGLGVYEALEKITHSVLASFETQMPESVRVAAAASFDPNEEGLAAALRGASQGDERQPASGAIFNRIATSRVNIGSIPPDTGSDDAEPIDRAATKAAPLPVTTFPENSDDGLLSKEKLAIAPAADASILTKGESGRVSTRVPESRSFDSARSRSSRSVLPPKSFAPLIPTAGAPRGHAPAPPPNATLQADRSPEPPPNATLQMDRGPAPPPNATTSHSPVATPTKAEPAQVKPAAAFEDKPAPKTPRTGTRAEPPAASPALPPPHKSTTERLDPTELFSIADLLEPASVGTPQPQPAPPPAKTEAKASPTERPRATEQSNVSAFITTPRPVEVVSIVDAPPAKPKVEPVAPKPEPVVAKVEPPKVEPVAPKPEPVAAKVEPPKVEPVAPKPEPVAAKVEPPKVEPVAPKPEPVAAKPVADAPSAPAPATQEHAPPPPPPPPPKPYAIGRTPAVGSKPAEHVAAPSEAAATSHAAVVHAAEAAHATAHKALGLSFADLWPDSDRALVHDVESAITAGRWSDAIEHADALVTRILTSSAALFGSADAIHDATSMVPILGIDGRRFLAFRSIVRATRSGNKASHHDALAAYAFAIEARMARASVR